LRAYSSNTAGSARANTDGDFIVADEDERSVLVFDLRRTDEKPILTMPESGDREWDV
jgi:hypothetical protein